MLFCVSPFFWFLERSRSYICGDRVTTCESIKLLQVRIGRKFKLKLNSKPTLLNRPSSDTVLIGVLAKKKRNTLTVIQRVGQWKVTERKKTEFFINCTWEVV